MINYIYYKFLYRPLMKLAHKHGWHHMRTCYPDGDTMLRCDWCGISVITKRAKNKNEKYPTGLLQVQNGVIRYEND